MNADPTIKNKNGYRPIDIATELYYQEIIQLLSPETINTQNNEKSYIEFQDL